MKLTMKEQTVLDLIKEFMLEQGFPPSVRDICDITGLQSTSSAHHYLNILRERGAIDFVDGQPRTITVDGLQYVDVEAEKKRIAEERDHEIRRKLWEQKRRFMRDLPNSLR